MQHNKNKGKNTCLRRYYSSFSDSFFKNYRYSLALFINFVNSFTAIKMFMSKIVYK